MKKLYQIKIFGRVQGVGFRYFLLEQADKLNISGLAMNLSDGSVYTEAEGEPENLKKFLEQCRTGPILAKVEKIEIKEAGIKNFSEFQIK
ncbi:MAG: acylphosphatase [Patescibacteria group bacterium]